MSARTTPTPEQAMRLMVAAPVLADALETFLRSHDKRTGRVEPYGCGCAPCGTARAALRKAGLDELRKEGLLR